MNQEGVWIVVAVLVVVGLFGTWWNKNNGRFKAKSEDDQEAARVFTEADLGQPLGTALTVVQFSSTFCQPCVATKRVIAHSLDLVKVEGIASIEINAEENLPLAREASVMRTPTVVLLDPSGKEVSRASGELRQQQFLGALGSVLADHGSEVLTNAGRGGTKK